MESSCYNNFSEEHNLLIIRNFIMEYAIGDSCEVHIEYLQQFLSFTNIPIIQIKEIISFGEPDCRNQLHLHFKNGAIILCINKYDNKVYYQCFYDFNDDIFIKSQNTVNLYDFINKIKYHKYKLKRYLLWISQYKIIEDKIQYNTKKNILNSLPDDVARYIISVYL